MTTFFPPVLMCCLLVCGDLQAQEHWTRFRGENGNGLSDDASIPTSWTENEFHWRAELPGQGHSSPVIWGDRVFVTSADLTAGARHLVCLSTTDGSIQWKQNWEFSKHKKHKQNSYASPTPVVDADRVYVLWQSSAGSSFSAWTHQGKPVWDVDLGEFKAGHGSAVSPVLHEGKLFLCIDQQGPSSLIAINAADGETIWKVERDTSRACYSTPCIYQPSGRKAELIVTHSYQGITSVNPDNGATNWEIKPFGTHKQRACASPIVAGDLIIGTSGFASAEKNVVAVRADYSGKEVTVSEVYRVSKTAPHVPTPIVYKEWMFLWTDRGIVTCVEVASGKQVWQKRVGGNFFGSPICIAGRLYNVDTLGNCVVIKASDEYELLAKNVLGEGSNATPAVAGGKLFLRTTTHLTCIQKK